MNSSQNFYSELPLYPFELDELFHTALTYSEVPDDWFVLCTDIVNSTEMFANGKSQEAWSLAAAGIDIALRSATVQGIEIPYIYGGDGILTCFPPELLKPITSDMMKLYDYGRSVVGANLRIGIIPVIDIHKQGFKFRVKKVGSKGTVPHSLFDDSAFKWIDHTIKNNSEYSLISVIGELKPEEFTFDEYVLPVWQRLETNYAGEVFMSLIVSQKSTNISHLDLYNMICDKFNEHAPRFFREHPIISMERDDILSLDFIKTDGDLKITISGEMTQLEQILKYLDSLESKGIIVYGHAFSSNSLITFVVKESNNFLAGLIDVEGGGYFKASRELKLKIKQLENSPN